MKQSSDKIAIAKQLQASIDALQGLGKVARDTACAKLSPFEAAFPENTFPTAAIHEFIRYEAASAASTNGFITEFLAVPELEHSTY